MPRRRLLLIMTLLFSGHAAAQAPRIGRPRPAPPEPTIMPPLPPAEIDNKLAIGGDDIRAREIGTRMSVDVLVNGRGPYRFLIDSGADTSAVGLRIANALQLPLGSPAILTGMTDRSIIDRVKVNELAFGASKITNLEVPALREEDLGSDGLLGIDALAQQRLMIDFESRQVKVEDARVRAAHLPGEIVITARRDRGQLILTRVRAAGVRLNAVVDTGSEVTIGNLALRDKLVRNKPDRESMTPMVGVTGKSITVQIAMIAELEIGSVTLRNVPIAFADLPPFEVFGLQNQPSLLLGTDILQAFRRVSLDFRARKVRFQLRRCGSQPITIGTSADPAFTVVSTGEQAVCGRSS